jgi:hypothetical protein
VLRLTLQWSVHPESGFIMRLDIYRRAEHDGKFSYLAVPETRNIPNEAINTDWEMEARAVEVDDDADRIEDYDIDRLNEQIAEKGYAVTALH